jgi:F420 biosynthesis protein FbiB-like protein
MQRVRNIAAQPTVTIVADTYTENWAELAFVKIQGKARVIEPGEAPFDAGIAALRAKYPQYHRMAIHERPMIVVEGFTAVSWRGSEKAGEIALRPDDLASVIHERRSVRAFQNKPIPTALVRQAIEAAGWAPSPHGRQPWRFAVLENPERKGALADAMSESWLTQLRMDGQEEAIVQDRLAKSRDRILTPPLLIIPCLYLDDLDVYPDPDRQAAETTMAIQSIGAAIQNLLLTIHGLGLDAGWMCAPLFVPDIVRDTLGLDGSLIPHALIPVGYAAKDPVRRPRMAPDQLIALWD